MVNCLTKCKSLFPDVERIRVLFEDAIGSRVFKPNNRCAESYNIHGWLLLELKKTIKQLNHGGNPIKPFGNISSCNKLLRQEWPAIHLAIIYSLCKEAKKGEYVLLPLLKAREEAFDKTSIVTGKALPCVLTTKVNFLSTVSRHIVILGGIYPKRHLFFHEGRLLKSIGNIVEGDAQLKRTMDLQREIVPDDHRTVEQLTDEDCDKLVWYFSR